MTLPSKQTPKGETIDDTAHRLTAASAVFNPQKRVILKLFAVSNGGQNKMSNSRVRASREGLKKLNAIRDANKWSYRQIEDTVFAKTSDTVSQDRIMAFFKGKNIYKSNALLICNALGFEPDDIIENHAIITNKNDINWTERCNKILISKRELAINLFTADMGVTIDLDQIHVPLGLIERKKKSKITEDIETEKGLRVYQNPSEETTTKIPYSIFENEVLPEFQSSSNRIISILGEAGSGKTVQLLKIAQWILEQGDLPIFISLGSIPIKENIKEVKPLLDYLFDDWLKQFSYQVPNQWIKDVELQLQQGKVWLLLDGADEIVGCSDPLGYLSKSLNIPLFQNVKVIFTCRSNLWEIGANALANLSNKTYRMMRFEYGDNNLETDTVSQFIDQWFRSSNPDLGKTLRQALDEPGKEQIRDLVTHPLMLSLLCFAWQYSDGKLPDTRASLYESFANAIFELQKGKFPSSTEDRLQLKEILGKLALDSIERGYKSILPYELVNEILEQPYPKLFDLAINLNWLKNVGIKSNTRQPVYAFFHPSFQEYFAALAIENDKFFLDYNNENYRIFETKWHETILLWIGLNNSQQKKQNREFIDNIINFQDSTGDKFYQLQALSFSGLIASEFPEIFNQDHEQFIDMLVMFAFDSNSISQFPTISEKARDILAKIDFTTAVNKVINFVNDNNLINFDCDKKFINITKKLLKTQSFGERSLELIVSFLGKFTNNVQAISFLIKLIEDFLAYLSSYPWDETFISFKMYNNVISNSIESLGNIAFTKIEVARLMVKIIDFNILKLGMNEDNPIDKDGINSFNSLKHTASMTLQKVSPDIYKDKLPKIQEIRSFLNNDILKIIKDLAIQNLDLDESSKDYKQRLIDCINKNVRLSSEESNKQAQAIYQLTEIAKGDDEVIDFFLNKILNNHSISSQITDALINIMETKEQIAHVLNKIKNQAQKLKEYEELIEHYNNEYQGWMKNPTRQVPKAVTNCWDNLKTSKNCRIIAEYCANNLGYSEFKSIYGSDLSLEKSSDSQRLNQQAKNEPYLITIKTQNLNPIIEPKDLFKRFKNRLIDAIPNEIKPRIKETIQKSQDIADLEAVFIDLKELLQTENIALILGNNKPSQLLQEFCEQLSDFVQIDWNR